MKSAIFTFLICWSIPAISQTETIRLKAEVKTGQPGYTGIAPIASFRNLSDSNPWKKTEYEISGIPEGWTEWFRESIWFQTYQWTYQNYKMGKMSADRFGSLMDSWGFDTVAGQYSSKPIACETTMIYRKTNDGKVEYMVDTDVDHDFGDEKVYEAIPNLKYSQIDSLVAFAPVLSYELFIEGRIEKRQTPFIVKKSEISGVGDIITHTMPTYAEVTIGTDTLIVNSGRPDFSRIMVSRKAELDPNSSRFLGKKLENGSRAKYDGKWYTIMDFDLVRNELVLEMIDITKDTIAANEGFYAPDFEFDEMISGHHISLSDLKGKYVLLDFWGTWCKPCIKGIPDLVELKEDLKEEPFEIISIAIASDREAFDILKDKHGMNWLHAWHPTHQGFKKDYNIDSYPTVFLLSPKGKIVGYNLSTAQVKAMVRAQK